MINCMLFNVLVKIFFTYGEHVNGSYIYLIIWAEENVKYVPLFLPAFHLD